MSSFNICPECGRCYGPNTKVPEGCFCKHPEWKNNPTAYDAYSSPGNEIREAFEKGGVEAVRERMNHLKSLRNDGGRLIDSYEHWFWRIWTGFGNRPRFTHLFLNVYFDKGE